MLIGEPASKALIADELRRRIAAGEIAPGRLLPSEPELAAGLRASRVTVRKALAQLKMDGTVDSARASAGTS